MCIEKNWHNLSVEYHITLFFLFYFFSYLFFRLGFYILFICCQLLLIVHLWGSMYA